MKEMGAMIVKSVVTWMTRVRFLAGAGNFTLDHHVQTSSVAHLAFYPIGTRGSFARGKVAGA
jgi:hypothetical protein